MNPQQALEEYIGEQFQEWLANYIPQQVKTWPIIQKIIAAHPKPEKLRKLVLQIFLTHEAFLGGREGDPGFLRFAIANLSESDDPQAETALEILEKRRTEELAGYKVEKGIIKTVKRDNWVKLLKAIGLSDEEINSAEPKEPTRNYVAEMSEVYSTFDWQVALGCLAAAERVIMEEGLAIEQLLKNNFNLSEKELAILSTSATASEIDHVLDKLVFDNEAKEMVWQGVTKQLEARAEFLSGLEKYLNS